MAEVVVTCHGCSTATAFEGPVPRSSLCDKCGESLRCCLNCRFHDGSVYNECSEPSAERVVDKSAANFCDLFRASTPAPGIAPGEGAGSVADDLENLFKK